ncbi:MAG TPA: hypothetical protein VGM62_17630 [Chthoniobacterales bacterium]|jgi:hypothetical protein
MNPYAKPNERKTGQARPKILHTGGVADSRTRQDRQREKEAIKTERRAIKKAARRHLKQQMLNDLKEAD